MRAVPDESMVHHLSGKAGVAVLGRPLPHSCAKEDALACVGIPHPFVEGEHAGEMGKIVDLSKQWIRDEVIDGECPRIAGKLRSEMPSGFHWELSATEPDMNFR